MAGLNRNDDVTIKLTAGEANQLMILAEDGFRSLMGKLVRQLNEQSPQQENPRPQRMAAE